MMFGVFLIVLIVQNMYKMILGVLFCSSLFTLNPASPSQKELWLVHRPGK